MPSARHILTFAEYAAIRHATPYVVDLEREGGRLVLFGGRHSSDPSDPMFDQIAGTFAEVAPALALHEGTPPAVEPEREIAIRRHGEAGLVRHLAARAGVATASMDIPLVDEARLLCREVSRGDALVYLVLRQLASFNRKTARMDFDRYFADFFALIGPGLGVPVGWPLVEREHARLLRRPLTRRAITARETDPMRDELPTQRLSRVSNLLRDEHMLDQLLAVVAAHGRVFASVGVSHAVMLEPALRAAVGAAREEGR